MIMYAGYQIYESLMINSYKKMKVPDISGMALKELPVLTENNKYKYQN